MSLTLPKRPEGVPADLDRMETGNPRRNAFWFACDADGARVNYAACRTRHAIIGTSLTGESPSWPQCAKALRAGACLCDAMVTAEINEGRAIWFIQRDGYDPERDALRPVEIPTALRTAAKENTSWRSSLRGTGATQAPIATGNPYADAINVAMAEAVAEKQRQVKPSDVDQNEFTSVQVKSVAPLPPTPSDLPKNSSPLARARAMMRSINQ